MSLLLGIRTFLTVICRWKSSAILACTLPSIVHVGCREILEEAKQKCMTDLLCYGMGVGRGADDVPIERSSLSPTPMLRAQKCFARSPASQ